MKIEIDIPDEVVQEFKLQINVEDVFIKNVLESHLLRSILNEKDFMSKKIIRTWAEKEMAKRTASLLRGMEKVYEKMKGENNA